VSQQNGLDHDGTEPTGSSKSDHDDDGMQKKNENVAHAQDGIKLSKLKNSGPLAEFATDSIRKTIKAALGSSAAELIDELNPKIRGWANYHWHVVSKRTFTRVDREIFSRLWRWARRRHRDKNLRWLKEKYFEQHGLRNWSFVGEMHDNQGQPHKVRLLLASDTPIKRHR
jgi:RNA-directed DNA polymerase